MDDLLTNPRAKNYLEGLSISRVKQKRIPFRMDPPSAKRQPHKPRPRVDVLGGGAAAAGSL